MVIRSLFDKLAKARQRAIATALGHRSDQQLTFVSYRALPRIRTLTVSPNDISTSHVAISYSHEHRSLQVEFHQDESFTLVLREEDIMVLSSKPFSPILFQEKLDAALFRQASKTTTILPNFQLHE